MEVEKKQKCPICSSSSKVHMDQCADIHYKIEGFYRVLKCLNCSLLFLDFNELEDIQGCAESPPSIYESNDYYAYQASENESFVDRLRWLWIIKNRGHGGSLEDTKTSWKEKMASWALEPYFQDFLWWVPQRKNEPRTFLDIGCGSGKIVNLMSRLGFESWGTDISELGGQVARGSNLKFVVGDFNQTDFPENYFDVIYSSHALEHMQDPVSVFSKIKKLLKPGGIGYVMVPNGSSLSARLFGRYWFFLGVPVHFINFNSKSIKLLLGRLNFEVLRIRMPGDFQGLLGSFQAFLNRNTGRTSHDGFVWNSRLLRSIVLPLCYLGSIFNFGSHLQVQFKKPLS